MNRSFAFLIKSEVSLTMFLSDLRFFLDFLLEELREWVNVDEESDDDEEELEEDEDDEGSSPSGESSWWFDEATGL